MGGEGEIKTPDAETTQKVVQSLVERGDISKLSQEERSRFYVNICESLGLTPATLPFAILRLNGKEVLYPTRGATDQLAAIHLLSREIVDGPRLIDLGGTKLIYAVCRVTHPNGRVETAIATVPASDPSNALMKAETKAKRRATLSILGLGVLDESELDTAGVSRSTEALASLYADIERTELPTEAVHLWIRYHDDLAKASPAQRGAAWQSLCKRVQQVGKINNAKEWLKKAIADETARKSSETKRSETGWTRKVQQAESSSKPGSDLIKLGKEIQGACSMALDAYGAAVGRFIERTDDKTKLEQFRKLYESVPESVRSAVSKTVDKAFASHDREPGAEG